MKNVKASATVALMACGILLAPGAARADSSHSGTAAVIDVFTDSSDYPQQGYKGSLTVTSNLNVYTFFWGGTWCAAYDTLNANQIANLTLAVSKGLTVMIWYRVGTNYAWCITGFRISAP